MKKDLVLTNAEEEVMQILWRLEKAIVRDIVEKYPDPKPAYNTVSTIIRILETKKIVSHKAYGKTYEYFPLISRDDYSRKFLKGFMKGYFNNSFHKMVSFFAASEDIDTKELEMILKNMKQQLDNKKKEKL